MGVRNFNDLIKHFGHHIIIASYGTNKKKSNVAIECEDCYEVLLDFDYNENLSTKDKIEPIFKEIFSNGFKTGLENYQDETDVNIHWEKFWNNR